jgi:hypothetical protein
MVTGTVVRPHPGYRLPVRRIGMAAGTAFVVLAALGFGLIHPTATLAASRTALARVVPGFASRVLNADGTVDGHRVPLLFRDGRLWPETPLAPRQPLAVTLTVGVWLAGWMTRTVHRDLVTPATPRLLSASVLLPVRGSTTVTLTEGVAALRIASFRTVPVGRGSPAPQWRIEGRDAKPGLHGLAAVWIRTRRWESWTRAGLLRWATPPALGVKAGPAGPDQIAMVFNQPVRLYRPAGLPPGRWTAPRPNILVFTAHSGWWPGQTVHLTLPAGSNGPEGQAGTELARPARLTWELPEAPVEQAQAALASLGYLPLAFVGHIPAGGAQNTRWDQIPGRFVWRYPHVPSALAALWDPGVDSVMTEGALMQFQHDHGLPPTGTLSPAVWQALAAALAAHARNPDGYTWIYVSETLPETLTLWHDGRVIFTSLANTGIPASPTALGTYPVYLRYRSQTMSGINPNGTPYDDPGVPWVNYFAGGDAVHGFVRAAYGFPQSLGCVELPVPVAARAWPYIHYGTLVTVMPSGSPRLPA